MGFSKFAQIKFEYGKAILKSELNYFVIILELSHSQGVSIVRENVTFEFDTNKFTAAIIHGQLNGYVRDPRTYFQLKIGQSEILGLTFSFVPTDPDLAFFQFSTPKFNTGELSLALNSSGNTSLNAESNKLEGTIKIGLTAKGWLKIGEQIIPRAVNNARILIVRETAVLVTSEFLAMSGIVAVSSLIFIGAVHTYIISLENAHRRVLYTWVAYGFTYEAFNYHDRNGPRQSDDTALNRDELIYYYTGKAMALELKRERGTTYVQNRLEQIFGNYPPHNIAASFDEYLFEVNVGFHGKRYWDVIKEIFSERTYQHGFFDSMLQDIQERITR
jgi:hypothetical protein